MAVKPTTPDQLLARLDALGRAVRDTGQALALLGLGSAGVERTRMDAYSDLDFYVIARPGTKDRFIHQLDWLEVAPIGYAFQNSPVGWKILYEDGVFVEYAIFEPDEMPRVQFAEGQLVWHAPDFDLSLAVPRTPARAPRLEDAVPWKVGEILTNLYVGLLRYHRGEKLSASRFVQSYAIDRLLELAPHLESVQPAHADVFQPERRFERRFPSLTSRLPDFIPGYAHTPAAARAILAFLKTHFKIEPFIEKAILRLCEE